MTTWDEAQKAEVSSWNIPEPDKRREKIERETARYPLLRRQMGIDLLDLSNKFVVEVGGGPIGTIADLPCKRKVVLDPLTEQYKKYWPCPHHLKGVGEAIPFQPGEVDVVVITNALDHCQTPEIVLHEALRVLRPGGWLAVHNAIDLASIHPHEGHRLNLDEFWFHNQIDSNFETIHELTFRKDGLRYGHILYNGRRGQPAWCGLYRKCTGYPTNEK